MPIGVLAQQSPAGEWIITIIVLAWAVCAAALTVRGRWHTLPTRADSPSAAGDRPERSGSLPPGWRELFGAVGMFAAGVLGAGVLGGTMATLVDDAVGNEMLLSVAGVWGQGIGGLIGVVIYLAVGGTLGAVRPFGRNILRGVITLLLVLPWCMLLLQLGARAEEWVTGEPHDPMGHVTLRRLAGGGWGAMEWLLVLGVTIAVPAFEEVLYRGLLQPAIRLMTGSAWVGIALSSAIFVLAHGGAAALSTMPALLLLSVTLGVVRERSGSIVPSIVAHALFNTVNVSIAAFM